MRSILLAGTAVVALVGATSTAPAQQQPPPEQQQQMQQQAAQPGQELQQLADQMHQQAQELRQQAEQLEQQAQQDPQQVQQQLQQFDQQVAALEQQVEQFRQQAQQHAQQHAQQQQQQLEQQPPEQQQQAQDPAQQQQQQAQQQPGEEQQFEQQVQQLQEEIQQLRQLTQQIQQEPEQAQQLAQQLHQHAQQIEQHTQQLGQQAQQFAQAQPMQPGEQQVAQACLEELQAFRQRAADEGYWLTPGYGTAWGTPGWGTTAAPGAADPAAVPPTTAPEGTAPPPAGTTADPQAGMAPGQPGVATAAADPRRDIHVLYNAAHVAAQRGFQESCETIVADLEQMFDQHVERIREAGIEPGQVETWRQEQLVAAVPVTEAEGTIRVDNILGADIRNPQDESLGTINDVILDPETGGVAYVVVGRGGFLGIGEEEYVVPWQALQVAPGMEAFVLNVPEEAVEQAPAYETGWFGDDRETFATRRQEADSYWQQYIGG